MLNNFVQPFGNTGVSPNSYDLKNLSGIILMDRSKSYTLSTYSDFAALVTALNTDALLATKLLRIYPYLRIKGIATGTAANTYKETEYGDQVDVYHEQPRFTLTLDECGGIYQLAEFKRWEENQNASVILVFKGPAGNSRLCGFSENGILSGLECRVFANKASFGAKINESKMIDLAFEDHEVFHSSNLMFIDSPENYLLHRHLSGIHDVKIGVVSATSSAVTISAVDSANGQPLGDSYQTALTQSGAWSLVTAAGVAQTISTVTYNATTKNFVLAGTGLVSGFVSLKDPTTLAALATPFGNGITGGYESNVATVTIS